MKLLLTPSDWRLGMRREWKRLSPGIGAEIEPGANGVGKGFAAHVLLVIMLGTCETLPDPYQEKSEILFRAARFEYCT